MLSGIKLYSNVDKMPVMELDSTIATELKELVPAVLQTSSRWRLIPVTVSPIGESLPSSPAFSKERTWKKRYLDGILCI
ncbi:hypothetical protein M8J76_003410 [Diaphorina citri]|nr:hypothetical protein M8J76_003410 [Diaphorina citri]KAI5744156.1 hypothetical protein M8J77_026233 [Diaphorina citri]